MGTAGRQDWSRAKIPSPARRRELEEETGYRAKKWKPLVEYYASPGFVGESMKVFVAEGLVAGDAHPEDDEQIELRLVKLSEVLKMIEKGAILDGKTLTSILLLLADRSARNAEHTEVKVNVIQQTPRWLLVPVQNVSQAEGRPHAFMDADVLYFSFCR